MEIDKKELRRDIRLRKKSYTSEELDAMSLSIMSELEQLDGFRNARTVLLYHSLPDEVRTHDFVEKWKSGKRILLPVVVGDILKLCVYDDSASLSTGAFDIEEPQGEEFDAFDEIDLAVVPGMSFDHNGHRLGRGKGFYDKLLPSVKCPKVGVCFDFQMVDYVPVEPHDVVMDMVLTDKGLVEE